jgi:single-strand DNA-binding protein
MILTGLARLGQDADVRYLQDGTAVANLSLAYNYGKKDSDGKRPTQWVKAAMWGERAEKAAPYLTKGTLLNVILDDVCIETYDKRDGGTGTNLKARVNSFEFAGGKPKDGEAPAEREGKPAESKRQAPKQTGGKFDDMDDDIPF